MTLGRVRGRILRLVRKRLVSVVVGLLLIVPAVWLKLDGAGGRWWVDGLSLVLGATGAAVLWTGVVGARPDWIDHS